MSSLLEQWKNEDAARGQGNGVRMALEASGDLTARKAARAIQLARDLGLPENFVVQNPYGAEQERIARQLEKAPTLAAFMEEDRLNAALLREDVEPMAGSGGVFDTIARLWNREKEAAGRAWDAGQAQREVARHGNRYLAALQSGDMETAARLQEQAREIEIRANPYADQEAFGMERPGTVETAAVPHVREIDGKAVLLPSVDGEGNALTEEAAAALFLQNGQHAGIFSSVEAARHFLSQPEARRRELFANWRRKPDSWMEATFGPNGGIKQLPRTFFDQLPTQANRAAWGAAAGFGTGAALALVGGQMGPQVAAPEEIVTVPVAATAGFTLGAKTGWSVGAAEAAFYAERGAFALDLARERDVNGQALSHETIVVAANTYGLLSAAVEGVGEAAFLALLKPLGLGIADKAGLNRFILSAVRNAARDKSTGAALLNLGARLTANAGVEGIEEGIQEALAIFTDFVAKNYENAVNDANFDTELFSKANAARIGEAMREGSVAGFWLGSGPIIVSGALDMQSAREAADYSEKHLALHEKVEGTNTKQLSPERMQSVLEAAGPAMTERVDLPADALMELYQGGTDLLTPLGISEADAGKAADAGHAITVPVSKLHAYLDQQRFEAAARIMRRNPDALNAAEAAGMDERLAADVRKVVELYQENAKVFDELAAEKNRLRAEVNNAIREVPGLRSQVEALAGDVDGYANTWLDAVERFALRMGASGQSPVEVFQRITLDSLRAARRASMAPESIIDADLTELAAKEAAEGAAKTKSAPAPTGGLRHLNAVTMDDVYALAEQTQDQFYTDVESWAGELGGTALFRTDKAGQRTLKNRARAERKLPDYDGDAARVVDILGGTILFDTRDQVEAAAGQIRKRIEASGGTVVRDKNRFANPAGGYKDYQLNYRYPNGFTVELQLNTKAMSEAKEKIGHKLYELQDLVKNIIDDPNSTEEAKAVATILRAKAGKASKTLYGSTGDQSNEIASFSSIIEPYVSMEAWTAELAGTSVYGKLSELLGFMRNSLKSLVRTYGNPSQSINSLTNTGEPSGRDSTRITGSEDISLSNSLRTSTTQPPSSSENITPGSAQGNVSNAKTGKIQGNETRILGKNGVDKARYEVWELDDVIPSHDPENGFARREDYPAVAQERPYHSDTGEQEKVRGNALSYQPAFVVNSDPTAGNGPPIITREGIVLGGNSRTMTLQLVYADRPNSAAAYRQNLTRQAAGFGIEPVALERMRRPILVRVVDGHMTPEEMAVKSRLYNQTTTQKLQAKAEGVSRARMITPTTLAAFSVDMADFDTLRQFLDSPRSKGFVRLLLQDGVIEQTEFFSLTEKGGRLNDSGKKLVEDALRGKVVADYDILEALPASVLNKLDRTIPALARLKARGEGWDLSHALTAALRIVGKAAAEGRKVEDWLGQVDLLDTDPDKKRPAVQALALTFANATQKEVAARFEVMAGEAERRTKGQGVLIAMPENRPGPAFVKAFLRPIVSVDGRTIADFDPRGNERHAALQWAYEHGGKGKTVSAALDRLQKTIGAKKSTPEQKAEAREMISRLSEFSGAISMYPPKLGPYFRYREGEELFQPSIDEIRAGDEALRRDAKAWAEKVDSFISGAFPARRPVTMLKQTPLVLSLLGARTDLKTVTTYNVLKKVLVDKHKLPAETVKQIPAAMTDPVMIFASGTVAGDYVMMLDIKDEKGASVVVPIALEQQSGRGEYAVNIVTSMYAQKNTDTNQPRNQWFISQMENGNLRYLNHKKSRLWLRASRLQLPGGLTRNGINKIYTEANLVKLREGNPSLYSGPDGDPRGSIQIYPEGYLINLFQGADLSTLLHETGHIFFEEMERMVRVGAADETMRRDYATMRDWLGATVGQPLTEEQKEQAARGFEAYLMEGKAPSVELESAFARFRKWLLTIYRSATRLNAPLTDEVRGVFDRLLSSEREIAATAARNELLDLTARELDALGLTGTARTTAAGLMGKGREAAARSLQKSRDANRKARLKKYTWEARDEVRAMPVYRVRRDLRKTPLDLEAVREGFGEDTASSLLKSLPGFARKDGGVDPEIFAVEHGYESAAAMFADVMNAPRQGDAIAEVVRRKEARHDVEYDAFEHLMETREVSIQMELVGRKLAELLGAADIEREAYIWAAERELAAMPLGRAVRTGNFLAAMRRALRQSRTALAGGDRKTALDAHRKAMLNMEFVRLSRELARRRNSAEGQIKRFIGMKKGDPDARYMVMDIGMRHGLVKFSAPLAEGRDVRTVQTWIQGVKEDGYEIFADERILYGPGRPWREMSVADFESLTETVAQIVTVERNRRKLLTARGKVDLDEAASEIARGILAHRKSKAVNTVEKRPAAVKALSGLHAIHTKIEALCLALDGDTMGAAWEYIYRPITEADDRQSARFREVRDALNGSGLFGAYTRKELALMGTRKELVSETGEQLTWENRIAVALNMGNEVNMERLRDGHNWTDAQIAAIVRPLTARDWQFVQAVWDYIASFKDEAFALQEEITGLRPAAVEAKPLTVRTADGQTLELEGGYYPIKYNADKGFMAFAREQREMDRELFGGRNYGAAMTRNGHLKERAAGGMGSPLLLELSVITDHLFNVVHDLTHRKAVLDVAKIIRHSTVREAIESTVGAEMYRQLQPWLQDVANERQEPMHAVHRWARWARASTSIMQMGFKATTILAQPLGITQTAELLGYKWTGVGLKRVYRNPMRLPELLEETFSRSPMMANRIKSFDREVRDIAKQLTPGMDRFAWMQTVRDKAFVPMGMVQMGVDLPTWWGAYAKGLRDFAGDEGRAARYADSIVRMSQGSGSTKDLARVQRGGDLLRLTTMFYSYFNTLYNLGARRITALKQHHAPADIFVAANTALLLWFVPAVFGELLAGRGPDDDEEPAEWAAMHILQYPFQAVVGIRDIANHVFGEYGYQITPAQAAPKALGQWFKSVSKALEKEDAGELGKPTAEAIGYLFGLPMKQPIITVGNLWDFVTGEDPDFAIRDLFFVKPK